jgi:hypothetical protein
MNSTSISRHTSRGLEVARRGREDAAGPDHRFAEERRHPLRVVTLDRRAEGLGIVPRHLGDVLDQLSVPGGVRGDAARESGGVHAV